MHLTLENRHEHCKTSLFRKNLISKLIPYQWFILLHFTFIAHRWKINEFFPSIINEEARARKYIKVQRTADKRTIPKRTMALKNLVSNVLIIGCYLLQWFQMGNPSYNSWQFTIYMVTGMLLLIFFPKNTHTTITTTTVFNSPISTAMTMIT